MSARMVQVSELRSRRGVIHRRQIVTVVTGNTPRGEKIKLSARDFDRVPRRTKIAVVSLRWQYRRDARRPEGGTAHGKGITQRSSEKGRSKPQEAPQEEGFGCCQRSGLRGSVRSPVKAIWDRHIRRNGLRPLPGRTGGSPRDDASRTVRVIQDRPHPRQEAMGWVDGGERKIGRKVNRCDPPHLPSS